MPIVTVPATWNDIRRAQTLPMLYASDTPVWFKTFVQTQYFQLTNQVNAMQTAIQAFKVLGIVAGNANVTFNLVHPYPDANYVIVALPDWNTTLWPSAINPGNATLAFGTVAPGNQGIYVITIR